MKEKPTFEKVGECLYRYSSNGVYYARLEKDRKEYRRSLRTTDRALAKRRLVDFQRQVGMVKVAARRLSLAEFCDRYLDTQQHRSESTRTEKARIVSRIKTTWPGGSQHPADKVQPSDVEVWLSTLGADRSASSTNGFIEVLRGVFALAVRDGAVHTSPVAEVKYRKRSAPVRKTPTFEEFEAVVVDIRAQRWNRHDAGDSADFIEFIGLAGLGQAEASSLTWGDVDWRTEQLTTFRHKTKRGFVIPLYPQLRPLLERVRQERGGSPPAGEKVFRVLDAKKAIAAACKRLELPAYSHRSFRRMFVTRAIERGVDVKVIAAWQGHRDGGKLILDTYSHVRATHSDAMAKLM